MHVNPRIRASSMTTALSSLHKSHTPRRTNSTVAGLNPRSLRVVVLGVGGVGKTAMVVRYVTKRFIGDYDPSLETIYRHTAVIDDQLVNFEIMDTAGQEDKSVKLEDKCKWGESFIFVYDVTDKYSFDELTRLKFIASYTHSRMRVNFKPCWILVGNKTDLAEHDRMVSTEEGMALARDLGCHVFREISVKESINDASDIFEDLWREFSRLSPRSPSTSQRRKFSCRIQDKISVLDSEACACASETLKSLAHGNNHHHANEALVTTLTSTLKRQSSFPLILYPHSRLFKLPLLKNSSSLDHERRIPSIPETDEESLPRSPDSEKSPNLRATAVEKRGWLQRRKAFSSENVSIIPPGSFSSPDREHSVLSSTSSSNASLNSVADATAKLRESHDLTGRIRSSSDASSVKRKNSEESNNLTFLYREHCLRHRNRKWDLQNCNQQFSHTFNGPPSIAGAYEVRGF